MDWYKQQMDKFREFRSQRFSKVAKFFLKLKINANIMTGFSFLCGILAVFFLFNNYGLFILFAALHLIGDGLDGVIARVSKTTKFGDYFEHICDGLIVFFILIKIGFYTSDYLFFIVAGLYFWYQAIYFFSRCQAPAIFTRSLTLVLLALYLPGVISITTNILLIILLVNGVVSLYSLARQLQYFVSLTQK
ncbi:MAG: CDP-alcohol phosphatidyltransferase family protein [Candidatus Woesearchaeota archaeon]